ncbi:MAG: acylneuraminate cytidylyltransferase family protein [Candidatus Margulisiibacteriota bacterium]
MIRHAFIFARGGSKGLPKKNIKELSGKPLIAYSIEMAKSHDLIDKVFVSTDDSEIKSVSQKYGAEIIDRPMNLATDTAGEFLSWKHAVEYLLKRNDKFDMFISLPATAPLRNAQDITNGIDKFDDETDFVISMTAANRNPFFNMVKQCDDHIDLIFSGDKAITRRQDAPAVFDLTTVIAVSSPLKILQYDSIFQGKVKGVEVPKERAIDIDDEMDFLFAEYLLEGYKNAKR